MSDRKEKAETGPERIKDILLESVQNISSCIEELVSSRPSTSYILMLVFLLFDPRFGMSLVTHYQNFVEDYLRISY